MIVRACQGGGILTALLCLPLLFVGQTSLADKKTSISTFDQELLKRVKKKHGKSAVFRLKHLSKLVQEDTKDLDELEKLDYVNSFFNQIPYYTDLVHWKEQDYWATPFEKLTTNGGDCEDYAIAKYFTLSELGVSEKKLRMTYVKAIKWGEAHMVLTYFKTPKAIPLVLDNINKKILPGTKREDLIPVYSFNGDGLWLAKGRGSGKRIGGSGKISLWQGLMKRMDDAGQ
jgi:predicted transglutaminase-like cysteine proteinase